MKVNVEVDCTPQEARAFLGLPDVSRLNEEFVDRAANMMSGASNIDQLKEFASHIAPMGMLGMQLVQNMMEAGARAAMGGKDGGS